MTHVIIWPHNQKVMWHVESESLNLSHHCILFHAYRSCVCEDITFSHVMLWSNDRRGMWLGKWEPFTLSYQLICHLTQQGKLFKKFAHRFDSIKITSENSTKVRMTYFNISVAVNTAEIITCELLMRWFKVIIVTISAVYFSYVLYVENA